MRFALLRPAAMSKYTRGACKSGKPLSRLSMNSALLPGRPALLHVVLACRLRLRGALQRMTLRPRRGPRHSARCALAPVLRPLRHITSMFTHCSHFQQVQVSFAELCTQDLRPLGMGSPEVDDVSGLALPDFLLANTRMLLAGGQSSLFRALREVFRIASEGRLAFPCWSGRADAYCAPLPCRSAVAHALGQLGGAFPFAGQSLCMPSIGGVVLALFGRGGLEHARSAESHCRHR